MSGKPQGISHTQTTPGAKKFLKLQAKIMYHMQGPLGGFPPEENK